MADFSFQNKTVVLMIKLPILGGAERQALGLAAFLKENYNCNIHLIITHSNEETKEFKQFASICGIHKIHYFGVPSLTIHNAFSILNLKKALRAYNYLRKIKREVTKLKPDVIIPFLNTPSKLAVLIYKSVGAKITFWHQLGLDTHSYEYLEKKAIRQTPLFIANAENGLEVFQNYYKVPKEKLFVLPQYVSIKKVVLDKSTLKKKFKIPEDALVIGMVAHYRVEKYQDLVIKAFNNIISSKKTHLVILGNKDNNIRTLNRYNELITLSKSLNCFDRIAFLSDESVEEVLNCLDIGVLMSEIEGTPNVVMEYMLYGLPVVSTHHIGCINLLKPSDYLIPNDTDILKNKLQNLITNDMLREEEGKENIKKIKEFGIENYVTKLEEIINKVI
jgi:glycosyltransferase involved in cell wall biosynthesis